MALRTSVAGVRDVLSGERKLYYGWWLLAASVAAMALGSGVSFWAFGLYVRPVEAEFGWSRAEISLGFSITLLTAGASGPLIGRWIDRHGPRSAILLGTVLTSLSYVLLATTQNLWQWYALWALHGAARQLMFFMPFMALIPRWFDRRRGLAVSILGTGFSLGGFVVLPVMSLVLDRVEWRGALVFSGVVVAAVFLAIGLFVVRDAPGEAEAGSDQQPSGDLEGLTLGEALRTPLFWVLAVALTLFFFGSFGWLVHQIPYYESVGISRERAAVIVSLAAGLGIGARLVAGFFADRVARFETFAMLLSASLALAMATLLVDHGPRGIAVFIVLWLVGSSGGPMIEALLLTRAFGLAHFSTILGALLLVETAGEIVSPTVTGAIYDATGSYEWALVMYIGTFLVALALFFVARRMRQPIAQ